MDKPVPTLEGIREAFRPLVEQEQKYREEDPAIRDQPCACCGLTWWNDKGQDGKVYCSVCLGRGHDEPEEESHV